MRKKKRWHHRPPWEEEDREKGWHHRPPWAEEDGGQGWEHGPSMPPWMQHRWGRTRRHPSDRFLFARFALIFGLFVLLACGALAVLGALIVFFLRPDTFPRPDPTAASHSLRWIFGLGAIVFLLALAVHRVGSLASRRFTAPLSETMKAADALAEGDLSARVPVKGSPEFRTFARSFNRMARALETADRQRRELLADVAHELRTPLTVVQGNLEGLRDGIYEATPEHLDLVMDEIQKLSRLVDDLRLLTLAEAGQLPLDAQPLDIAQLLADVRDTFAFQADEAGIALTVDAPASLPHLLADPQRMGQVLGNLVSNALRFTPRGGEISLGAARVPGDRAVQLWVSDTGAGIPAEDLPRIFDRFWRGDPARSHESGAGTGLGLAIAKSLVEAHGGRIWAESKVGQGTAVICIFPLPPSP